MTGVAQDITEIKETQAALKQANEQLHVPSRRRFEVQEDERRHLARELHDQIGQALTAAKINLQSARRLKERNALVRRPDDGLAIVEGLLQQVRQLSLELPGRHSWTTWGWCQRCAGTLTSRRRTAGCASSFSRTRSLVAWMWPSRQPASGWLRKR